VDGWLSALSLVDRQTTACSPGRLGVLPPSLGRFRDKARGDVTYRWPPFLNDGREGLEWAGAPVLLAQSAKPECDFASFSSRSGRDRFAGFLANNRGVQSRALPVRKTIFLLRCIGANRMQAREGVCVSVDGRVIVLHCEPGGDSSGHRNWLGKTATGS